MESPMDVSTLEDGEILDSQRSSSLGQLQNSNVDLILSSPTVNCQEVFEILYHRYGFVLSKGDGDASMSDETTHNPAIEKQWQLLTKIIASNAAVMPNVTESVSLAFGFMVVFFDKGDVPKPETQITWDMNEQCACPLREIMDKSLLRITRQSDGSEGDSVIFYTISSKPDSETRPRGKMDWTLATQDPITVLDAVRRQLGPNIESVVNFLVHSGISFNTIVASNTYPPPPRLRLSPPVGLGTYLRSFSPDPEDYRLYEEARNDFLRGPFGRAALLKGGIIWRLAMEVVPIHEVFNGPTQLATDFGQVVLTIGGDDMIDDNLSDEQLGLISGLYHIGHGHNLKQISWWPKYTTWKGCGLDVGYWSSSCETWFQNRLRGIRNGIALPRTTKEWKNSLSYQKQTPIVMDNSRKAADTFLSAYFNRSC